MILPLTLRIRSLEPGEPVFMVVISARTAPKAVQRNLIRRRIVGAFRGIAHTLPHEKRYIITVRDPKIPRGKDLQAMLLVLIQKSVIVPR